MHNNAYRLLQILSAFSVLFVLFLPQITLAGQYQVSRVIDGDTIEIKKGATKLIVRLVGIDAPEVSHKKHEPGQPYSQQSTKHLAKIALNRSADVRSYGADRNGRTLGEVFLLGGKNVNIEMIQAGLAEVYRGKPASGLDMEPYWKAEDEARKAGRGMWQLGDKYVSPREWRRNMEN
jgi:micrococcal nuclease